MRNERQLLRIMFRVAQVAIFAMLATAAASLPMRYDEQLAPGISADQAWRAAMLAQARLAGYERMPAETGNELWQGEVAQEPEEALPGDPQISYSRLQIPALNQPVGERVQGPTDDSGFSMLLARHPAVVPTSSTTTTSTGHGKFVEEFAGPRQESSASVSVLVLGSGSAVAVAVLVLVAVVLLVRKRRLSRASLKSLPPPKILINSPLEPYMTKRGAPFTFPYVSIPQVRKASEATDPYIPMRRHGVSLGATGAGSGDDATGSSLNPAVVAVQRPSFRESIYDPSDSRRNSNAENSETDDPSAIAAEIAAAEMPRSESANSLVSTLGKVGFMLQYSPETEELKVYIIGASGLNAKSRRHSVDPFIRLTIIPDKHQKFSTKVKRNTSNPIYDEEFAFSIKKTALDDKHLKLKACDYDKFSRQIVIGYVKFELKEAGIHSGVTREVKTGEFWRELKETLDTDTERCSVGGVLLSLKYDEISRLFSIDCIQARELRWQRESTSGLRFDNESIGGLYVKFELYEGKRVIKSKKTDIVRGTKDPIFDETFNMHVPGNYLYDIFCEVSVWYKGRFGRKKCIGKAAVGPVSFVSSPPGVAHWDEMMQKPNVKVSQWHTLQQ
ncbi:unnamed protein product [Notodromas monacha]|uniref:C2 domain-containing protein n=1 Tax=Notodromas monacha TaxID=399045 RepID=A0A7R9BD23_9CRUS|nr:unnamed protein product [Notodromas monacha]CAG0912284.1 unnamed protein product [Notodromas monacha]